MLWNEFLIGGLLLPTTHGDFQLSFKSIHESNDIVAAFKRRIPSNAIDDICKLSDCQTWRYIHFFNLTTYLQPGVVCFRQPWGHIQVKHFADLAFEARLLTLMGIGLPLVP